MGPTASATTVVEDLLRALGARAAGLWTVHGESLVQAAFAACPEMPADVARTFAESTRNVPLLDQSLGIVAAAMTGDVRVSRVAELAAETGSGRWLRAFGAERSVAVPLRGARGAVVAVLSVALGRGAASDASVAEHVRAAGRRLGP